MLHGTHTKKNKIREDNDVYLAGFENWLNNKGLSKKTVNTHMSNVEFYINEYLCYVALDVSHGTHEINGFLGNWFIRKAAWSSCDHIKTIASSIKKFYAYLLEDGVIEQDDYDALCCTIKEYLPNWLEEMKRYEATLFEDYYY